MSSAKEVKAYLKDHGIPTKDIRVRCDSSINVTLCCPYHLDITEIETLLKDKFESYQRCEHSGEILSGGNTFVFVEYDWELMEQIAMELKVPVERFLQKFSGAYAIPTLVKEYLEIEDYQYHKEIMAKSLKRAIHSYVLSGEQIEGLTIDSY